MVIGLMGESGAGKTTSMRNLDPATTVYIDCDKKGLSWKGWKSQYNTENKNYLKTDYPQVALQMLQRVNTEKAFKKVQTVIVDTLNGLMVADEMRRSKEKGYDKWLDLVTSVYELVDYALTVRDDLTVIFVCHTQTERDDAGYSFTRIKTSGRKLDKIVLESKFTTVLLAKCVDGKYLFETQSKFSTAKSPFGALEFEMENDITEVIKRLEEY